MGSETVVFKVGNSLAVRLVATVAYPVAPAYVNDGRATP